ncbi:TRAP transporter substrate-binding protein DctP [Aestuariibacter sp. AA17]|uniref:TRAP transporter substrate-binding protein DctP n=1 Tax=Fluctibacter corallii TaxID=2984329 RepID=A0ABT3A549_9ALTE|nr:TRAP transporter substrate-binding protein DctP [Aestuariibacter sp. AA17]MCV2883812.1 TRAP transporter substrate-binding protein DctP [Aestuariibacter sp. AA17]
MKCTFILALLILFSHSSLASTLKIATLSPDGTAWMKLMREGAREVEDATSGRVKIKFYPGGVMGSDSAVMRKIRLRQLHGAALPTGALYDAAPNLRLYNVPALFQSFDEVDTVRKTLDPIMLSELELGGFVSLGFAEGGFAYLMSKKPISNLNEIQQRKVWVPEGDDYILDVVRNFGVMPIPLGIADVLAALQTGMIDTVSSSPTGAIALQWHTQVSHMMDFPILYFLGTLVIDSKAFSKLKQEDQLVVKRIMRAKFADIDMANRRDNLSAYLAMQKMGVKLHKLAPEEAANWRMRAEQLSSMLTEQEQVSIDLYVKIKQLLNAPQ